MPKEGVLEVAPLLDPGPFLFGAPFLVFRANLNIIDAPGALASTGANDFVDSGRVPSKYHN